MIDIIVLYGLGVVHHDDGDDLPVMRTNERRTRITSSSPYSI